MRFTRFFGLTPCPLCVEASIPRVAALRISRLFYRTSCCLLSMPWPSDVAVSGRRAREPLPEYPLGDSSHVGPSRSTRRATWRGGFVLRVTLVSPLSRDGGICCSWRTFCASAPCVPRRRCLQCLPKGQTTACQRLIMLTREN